MTPEDKEKAYKDYARACYLMGSLETYKHLLNILLSTNDLSAYMAEKINDIDTEIISIKNQLQQLSDRNILNPLFKKVKW